MALKDIVLVYSGGSSHRSMLKLAIVEDDCFQYRVSYKMPQIVSRTILESGYCHLGMFL